ncbi:MAG: hypothetical protein AAGF12_26410 [Myxococcota bacterium]
MAFRDDREALRHRIRGLDDELESKRSELASVTAALASEERDVQSQARLASGKGIGVIIGVGALLPMFVFVFLMTSSRPSDDTRLFYGDVVLATGDAPVPGGTRCTMFLSPHDGSYSHRIQLLCGDRLLYGSGSLGYIDCVSGRFVERCLDDEFEDDPAVEFVRSEKRIAIRDTSPDWSLEIVLTTPPGGAR